MAMNVFALTTTTFGFQGTDYTIREGEVWNSDDPLVKAYPDLFDIRPPKVRTSVGYVEQATAAPGEKRTTKRG